MWNDSIYIKSIQFSLSCGTDKIDCKMIDGIFWVILYCIVPNQLCTFSFTGRLWKSIYYVGCTIHWNELQDTFLRQPVNYSFPTDTLASLLKNGGESILNWKDCFPKKNHFKLIFEWPAGAAAVTAAHLDCMINGERNRWRDREREGSKRMEQLGY
jgi:hypothetical protein